MPRPDPRRPPAGQMPLIPIEATTKDDVLVSSGRHSSAMQSAIEAAREGGTLEAMDAGLATVLMAGAYSLDQFEAQNKPYGPTKLLSQMVEALREAQMTPTSRVTQTDEQIMDLLSELAEAE